MAAEREMKPIYKTIKVIDRKKQAAAAKALRKAAGMSLREVAEKLGVSIPFVFYLESGTENWTAERVRQFSRACKKKV